MFQLLQTQFTMHFAIQMWLIITDIPNAAVGMPDALDIASHIPVVLDAGDFYQSLLTLQSLRNHPVAGFKLQRFRFFPDGHLRRGLGGTCNP